VSENKVSENIPQTEAPDAESALHSDREETRSAVRSAMSLF